MKFSIALRVLAGFIFVVSDIVAASNVTWGFIRPHDRLLAVDHVVIPKAWFDSQKTELVFPPKGYINRVTLSAVRVYDWGGRKAFSDVSLAKGGPGYRNATISMESQKRKPLNVTIEFFGS